MSRPPIFYLNVIWRRMVMHPLQLFFTSNVMLNGKIPIGIHLLLKDK